MMTIKLKMELCQALMLKFLRHISYVHGPSFRRQQHCQLAGFSITRFPSWRIIIGIVGLCSEATYGNNVHLGYCPLCHSIAFEQTVCLFRLFLVLQCECYFVCFAATSMKTGNPAKVRLLRYTSVVISISGCFTGCVLYIVCRLIAITSAMKNQLAGMDVYKAIVTAATTRQECLDQLFH